MEIEHKKKKVYLLSMCTWSKDQFYTIEVCAGVWVSACVCVDKNGLKWNMKRQSKTEKEPDSNPIK